MKLGDLEFHILSDGSLRLDGGAMFGVVPRPLWERKMPPDSRNRIALCMNCLLVRTGGKTILVETGAGTKWEPKLADIYGIGEPPRLGAELERHRVKPGQVDIVINTHLHFDHCGGNTERVGGEVRPTFPNARYVVQRGEMAHAKNPTERDRASFDPENFLPVEASGQWDLVEGDMEVAPGVELLRAPGHTRDMQCVRLTGGGKTAFFFADLMPTAAHLGYPWVMGYDLYPLTTLESKHKWIPAAAHGEWLALLAHDPVNRAGYIRERHGKMEFEGVEAD
jgi:glyoxylase-like metal-dependent hydrolase (beta-lactamase superfamily II)